MRFVLLLALSMMVACAPIRRGPAMGVQQDAMANSAALRAMMAEEQEDYEAAVTQWWLAVQVDGRAPDLRRRLSEALWQAGQPEQALDVCKSARKDLGDTPGLLLQESRLMSFFGQADRALVLARKATVLDPRRVEAWTTVLLLETESGRPERALEALGVALILRPNDEDLWWRQVHLLESMGQSDEAFEVLEAYVQRLPDNQVFWDEYILQANRQGQWGRGKATLEALADRMGAYQALLGLVQMATEAANPGPTDALLKRVEAFGGSLARLGRSMRVENALLFRDLQLTHELIQDAEALGWENDQVVVWKARAYATGSDWDSALQLLADQDRARPEEGWDYMALDLLQEMGQWEELSRRLEQHLNEGPEMLLQAIYAAMELEDWPTVQARIDLLRPFDLDQAQLAQANLLSAQGDFGGAVALLRDRLTLVPKDDAARRVLVGVLLDQGLRAEALGEVAQIQALDLDLSVFRAGLMYELGQREEAEALAADILLQAPGRSDALNFLGYTWADENRNLDQALSYVREALGGEPWNPAYVDSLGWVLFRQQRPQEALERLRLANLLMGEDDPELCDHLGQVLESMGELDEARVWYHRALESLNQQKGSYEDLRARLRAKLETP